jgi:SAM-dependent methyltransferase
MQTAIEFFDEKAADWEATCYPPSVRRRLKALVAEFGLSVGARILDIGTGPGVLLPYLQERIGPDGHICAFDRSLPMVHQADQKRRWLRDLVMQGDVHHIPLREDGFDHVICFAAFPHFDHPELALAEMVRVAAPGGEVVIAHLLSRDELAAHHGTHPAVRSHGLPTTRRMAALMQLAGLAACQVVDQPGLYLARGKKPPGLGTPSLYKIQASPCSSIIQYYP